VYTGGYEKGTSAQEYNWYDFFSNYSGYVLLTHREIVC
jgi:hypothetical protein